jgi:hypothetical protein
MWLLNTYQSMTWNHLTTYMADRVHSTSDLHDELMSVQWLHSELKDSWIVTKDFN